LNALEAALRLKGEGDAVTALAYGEQPAEVALYQARAKGANRAMWVRGPALREVDAGVVAKVIERAIARVGAVEVVALGATVLDADLGQVGARLAQALGWAFVPGAWALEQAKGRVRAVQPGPEGFRRVEADGPVVATLVADCNKPRLAPAAQIINVHAEARAVEVIQLADLGLDEGDLGASAKVLGEAFPPERTWGKRAEGGLETVAREIAATLPVR